MPCHAPAAWVRFDEGVHQIGHTGDGFCFDNETPRHRTLLEPFAIGSRRDQRICVGRHEFAICCGETIRTECSYKYTLDVFAALADDFVLDGVWIDEHRLFSVQYLVVR